MSELLRCGLQGLPAAETALVRTLFKLYLHGAEEFRWSLVDAPPYDAVLVDAGSTHLSAEHERAGVRAVLTLTRPLRSEMLETWLLQSQREILAEGKPKSQAQFTTAAAPESPKSAEPPARQTDAYKLMRWPPAAMLRNDPTLIRMATVLSRRAMTIMELAQVSQQPLDNAQTFALALRDAGLLVSPMTAKVSSPPPLQVSASRSTQMPRKPERSLMNRIRVRLGI